MNSLDQNMDTVKHLEAFIATCQAKVANHVTLRILADMQRHIEAGWRYYDALHHGALLFLQAVIDA